MEWLTDFNVSVLFGLIVTLIVFSIYVHLSFRQLDEVIRFVKRDDGLNGLRYLILSLLVLSVVTAVPSMIYLSIRLFGGENESLRDVVVITGNVSRLASAILLVLIFRYQRRHK